MCDFHGHEYEALELRSGRASALLGFLAVTSTSNFIFNYIRGEATLHVRQEMHLTVTKTYQNTKFENRISQQLHDRIH
jgi:hypothetical protein